MERRELIASLQTHAEGIRTEAENKMTVLLDAARALQAMDDATPADSPETVAPANGKPSITELIRKVFSESPNRVYDGAQVRGILITADPDDAKRIKNGTGQALSALQKATFIEKVPGGFQLRQPAPAA